MREKCGVPGLLGIGLEEAESLFEIMDVNHRR